MQLYLIRHAQSANNDLYVRTGASEGRSADPPLTDLGHRQSELLARFLAQPQQDPDGDPAHAVAFTARHNRHGFGLTHLYCSLMTRAIQTGSAIATETGLPMDGLIDVHERGGIHNIDEVTGEDVGVPGPERAWFAAEYPHLILPDALGDGGWWNRPPETIDEAFVRARNVWSQLLERHGGTEDRVALVSHFGFFQSLLTVMLATEGNPGVRTFGLSHMMFGMSNASISRFEFDGEYFVVRYLNRVDFLPDELVTG